MTDHQRANLLFAHLPFTRDKAKAEQLANDMLASIRFSGGPPDESAFAAAGSVHVPMPALDAAGAVGHAYEVWRTDGTVTHGQRNALRYRHNDDILFGAIQLTEAEFDTKAVRDAGKTPLQAATEHAYREIFYLTDALDFPGILRFWNYFADINGESDGSERYWQFNAGRQDGFVAGRRKLAGSVPAASALGFAQGPLTVYFFAARGVMPLAIENPRQLSAYQYPATYGPRSPTFSRAGVVRLGGKDILFLSGTASIVGHQSLHAGDVVAQTRETVANIVQIVAEANRVAPQAGFSVGELCCKVYLRHASDVIAVQAELCRSLGKTVHATFLHADICRPDLLMEIEATAGHPIAPSFA